MKSYFHSFFYSFLFILLVNYSTTHKANAQQLPHIDSVDMLITNIAIQIECTAAINNMYNFKFKESESIFLWLRRVYPKHPLPYFLMGLNYWWRLMPDSKATQYDDRLLANLDSAIMMAEDIFENQSGKKKIEAAYFLAASHGFKGRLYSERKSWTKAAFEGKRALKFMESAADKGDLSPELLFGDGLYNYYSIWIPENYPSLKPILWFFKDGDKALGIKQLEEVEAEAFYTKTEAQYFLMGIYEEEKQLEKSLRISNYLHYQFPDNGYFHRYYAKTLYLMGDVRELEKVSLSLLAKVDSAQVGYEDVSGRYACFFLGYVYRYHFRNFEKATMYLKRSLVFGEKSEDMDKGYSLYALQYLGDIAFDQKNDKEAEAYYERIIENADRGHASREHAKEKLKEIKKRN